MRGKSGKPRLKRYWRESIEIPLRRDDVCGFDTALSGNGFRISVSKISEVSSIGEISKYLLVFTIFDPRLGKMKRMF